MEGQLDTLKVPKDELAITLVLLYIRGNTYDTKQAFCKMLTVKYPVDFVFQRAILVEHHLSRNDLKMTTAVIETIYEWTLTESPLRKVAVRCSLDSWCENRDECRTESQAELAGAEQKRGSKPGWVSLDQEICRLPLLTLV